MPPRIVRAARLVEDIRFGAGATGFVFDYDKRVVNDERLTPAPPFGTEYCPPLTTLLGKLTGYDPVTGMIRTSSAAREGVALTIVTRPQARLPMMTGIETGPCVIRETGMQSKSGLGFLTQPFSLRRLQAFNGDETPDPIKFRVRGRFGAPTMRAPGRTRRTLNFANGNEQITITTKLVLRRCPRRGGLTNAGC